MAGRGESTLADLFFGDEEAGAHELIAVLGAVGEEGLQAGFDVGGDVDDKGGADVGVEGGIEDLEGAVWGAGEVEFGEAGGEAGFVAKGGGGVVVGVAALPVREDDDAGAETADDGGDLQAGFEGVLERAIWKIEGFAVGDLEDCGGRVGFGLTLGGGAPSAGFTAGEIEDGGGEAQSLLDEEGAAAGLLYVISMGGDGENVYSVHDYGSAD